ncbi:MAG: hypothetical protein UU77_C0006G0014 [candidate division WWE3 bacterium GW2011_GWC1_41_7]|uniref:Uncharacterized protein n=2 Tax=Katanobacteria TaxID=422282 RepID=A0A0G0XA34_UNCKA|nr:MAG: hypothetical protein UU77_C0006G0014 [candidate division WWE3 bacterium GW2011_GWC1_41_7]KKS22068.1 MAG: hypothetical protein UU80_C0014G0023 [candidate division WWE3 bacterium GW2011_GWA1_41_8]
MKWEKFYELATRHPELWGLMRTCATPYANTTGEQVREFVQKVVRYIAFRPYDTLDLEASSELRTSCQFPGLYDNRLTWEGIDYWVYFWVGTEQLPRARHVGSDAGEPRIKTTLLHLKNWYADFEEELGPVHGAFVLKITTTGGVSGRINVCYDIYPLPGESF